MQRFLKKNLLGRSIQEIASIMRNNILSNPPDLGVGGIRIRPNPRFWGVMQNLIPSNTPLGVNRPNKFHITPQFLGIRQN
jgi:hypothetical protein